MLKKYKHNTSSGMVQDLSNNIPLNKFYYDALNISTYNIEEGNKYAFSNEKGNKKILEIPIISINNVNKTISYNNTIIPYINDDISLLTTSINNQIIIGNVPTRDSVILFSTNNTVDCIWEIEKIIEAPSLKLLYVGNLDFSTSNPIQALFNYENNILQKIYFVDGINQLRFFNKENINLINKKATNFNIVSNFNTSQPEVLNDGGLGAHTSGMVQYAFNLYNKYGNQTTISPLSDLFPIDKGLGGGAINEELGKSIIAKISNIDDNYEYIKVYSVKYTSLNQLPDISIIIDKKITNYNNYTFSDTGTSISKISIDEFIFLGGDPIIPKHIENKYNRLFLFNIKEKPYILDIDTRAYSHNNNGRADIISNIQPIDNSTFNKDTLENIQNIDYNVINEHDSVNADYSIFKYQADGTTLGGEGKYIKYEIVQKTENEFSNYDLKLLKVFKDDEFYRIGIQFYNKLGQKTEVKWIADFKAPIGNLLGNYNTLSVSIKEPAFSNYINSLNLKNDFKPIGYKIVRADRTYLDKTILSQGSLSGMFVQTIDHADSSWAYYVRNLSNRETDSDKNIKYPLPISRTFGDDPLYPLFGTEHCKMMHEGRNEGDDEIYRDNDPDFKRQHSWQYTRMYQMYTPDVFLNNLSFSDNLKIRILGVMRHTTTNSWFKSELPDSLEIHNDFKLINTSHIPDYDDNGVIGPDAHIYSITGGYADRNRRMGYYLHNRVYNNFYPSTNRFSYFIYGKPEFTEKGQGITYYNNNSKFAYSNNLLNIISDNRKYGTAQKYLPGTDGINTYGNKCITIMEGDGEEQLNHKKLEDFITADASLTNNDGLLFVEIVRGDNYEYIGNIYGGLTYESKKRTSYIEIGKYSAISNVSVSIENPGDTYVQPFRYSRLIKTDTEVHDYHKMQLTEIIEFPTETQVNLLNRNDFSLLTWDNKFQPNYNEYNSYNKVYSQNNNLLYRYSDNYKIDKILSFDNKILATKTKKPGEYIDNWTDILFNEELSLDGKYGGINGTINLNNNIFAFQDSAVTKINILPRVQVQGSDNVSLELGTGKVLHDYTYISTESGSLNKWGIIKSPNTFYYIDILNKKVCKLNNGRIENLSDIKNMSSFFNKYLDTTTLLLDNPILRNGITGIYDEKTKRIYFTVLQDTLLNIDSNGNITNNTSKNLFDYTIAFNEKRDYFESRFSFLPSIYFSKGDSLFSNDKNSKNIYEYYIGNYTTYFNNKYKNEIVLKINPDVDLDKVFNNIEYKSIIKLDDIDVANSTLTHITIWNAYQNSGRIPLIVGRDANLRRKFRDWNLIIPRNEGTRDRIRSPWVFIKLELDTASNYKMILNDIIISYTI